MKTTQQTTGRKKPKNNHLFALLLCAALLAGGLGWTFYRDHRLSAGPTVRVTAEITEVVNRAVGGVGYRNSRPQLTCRYRMNGIEYEKSFYFPDELSGTVRVGSCIELTVSAGNADIFVWNKDRGVFQCASAAD